MRIDKFLKNSRIIKRRSVAKESAESGRIKVNEKIVKPGTEVKPGDIIEIEFGNRIVKFEVLELIESSRKDTAEDMFRVIEG